MTATIENKTFDEIQVGDAASFVRALDKNDVETWAVMTGNVNLIDLDPGPADTSMFARGGGQAGWASVLFTTLAGTKLPGIGSITRRIDVDFIKPVGFGIPVTATVTVTGKHPDTQSVILDCSATNPAGEVVFKGTAEIIAPTAKMHHALSELPKVQLRREDRYLLLLKACEGLPTMSCAVAHPFSEDALIGEAFVIYWPIGHWGGL